MKAWIRTLISRTPSIRRGVRAYYSRFGGYPDWSSILKPERAAWEEARASARGGPKVLIATSVGAFIPGTTFESLLAVALTLRGAEVHALLCDAALPACMEAVYQWHPDPERLEESGISRSFCRDCFAPAERTFESLGITLHRFSDTLTPDDRQAAVRVSREVPTDEIRDYRHDGLAVGEHAYASALRFYARGTLDSEPEGEFTLRSHLEAALLTAFAANRLMKREGFAHAVFHHGIYVPQGLIGEVARSRKVPVVNWNVSYRRSSFIFGHDDTYHRTLMNEPVAAWADHPWTDEMETELMTYLESRRVGTHDWIFLHQKHEENIERISKLLGVDFSRPSIGLLTNVMWDAQVHYPANAFPNMLEWVLQTIRYFSRRPELNLLILVHPAERTAPIASRQPLTEEIRRAFPQLPKNVFLIPPDSPVSTYATMDQCNAGIIYGTRTGVEMACRAIPVIVVGEAWVRNKGVTMDADSEESYWRLLDRLPLPGRMDEAQTQRARKYAHYFFLRRSIPLDFIEPTSGPPMFKIRWPGLDAIRPGAHPQLDVICRGILEGTPFVVSDRKSSP